jgi:hypothetical protein
MIKNKMEIESYSFVLEPAYKRDGSVYSWEILTKNLPGKMLIMIQAIRRYSVLVR